MKNKPNMYRVFYDVHEGNNYAGGTVERFKDITDLSSLQRFGGFNRVQEVYIEFGDVLSDKETQNAIDAENERIDEAQRADEVYRLKRRLEELGG